jgi:hypothetical protein
MIPMQLGAEALSHLYVKLSATELYLYRRERRRTIVLEQAMFRASVALRPRAPTRACYPVPRP